MDESEAQALQWAFVASATLLVSLIWPALAFKGKRKVVATDVLFLVSRYLVFSDMSLHLGIGDSVLISSTTVATGIGPQTLDCRAVVACINMLFTAGVALSEGTLLWCLCALTSASRRAKIVAAAIYITVVAAAFTLVALSIPNTQFREIISESTTALGSFSPGCFPDQAYSIFLIPAVGLLLAGELVLLVSAVYSVAQKYINESRSGGLNREKPGEGIWWTGGKFVGIIMFRDGIIYYVVLLCLSATASLIFPPGSRDSISALTFYTLVQSLQRVAHTILANRFLLNIRSRFRQGYNENGSTLNSMAISDPQVASTEWEFARAGVSDSSENTRLALREVANATCRQVRPPE
ncbi:hypothetical protein FA15DRAFT_727317 [Coprinopsis marcescibilis]|uniref:Uncharacterized protein n=1 Tax=Coprinopsis marcescibilis TaxID=230819 RepID=A0A5C3KGA7_COPMA|nr:hypothetical protein FA15DRAFT_727317 [Coprinopsis marcescibilis]